MKDYKLIGIDLAKKKFHFAAINSKNEVINKGIIYREELEEALSSRFVPNSTFAFEACAGCHYLAQKLKKIGHKAKNIKTKNMKPYAKTKQKNDINDAIAICKTAIDPELMKIRAKSKKEQEVSYLHKSRQNTIKMRIKRSNALITSLLEFGYMVNCKKAEFAKKSKEFIEEAFNLDFIGEEVYEQMILDAEEISELIAREKTLNQKLIILNKASESAQILSTIPGIGPINASILSIKPVGSYKYAKDFAASLGLVPKQNTTGGNIKLGSITKQGDRYARTMLIQAARSLVMRSNKEKSPNCALYQFISRLKGKQKAFNVTCVAVANKLARIAYACMIKREVYS